MRRREREGEKKRKRAAFSGCLLFLAVADGVPRLPRLPLIVVTESDTGLDLDAIPLVKGISSEYWTLLDVRHQPAAASQSRGHALNTTRGLKFGSLLDFIIKLDFVRLYYLT